MQINTQAIPPSAPLISNLPSGRDIHSPPAPYNPPLLEDDQLMRMRAPPDDNFDQQLANDHDDSEEEYLADARKTPGAFPDRSQTSSSVYY